MGHSDFDEIPWFSALTTYFAYSVLMLFGQMRDFFARTTGYSRYLGGNSSPQKVGVPTTLCSVDAGAHRTAR